MTHAPPTFLRFSLFALFIADGAEFADTGFVVDATLIYIAVTFCWHLIFVAAGAICPPLLLPLIYRRSAARLLRRSDIFFR